MHWLDWIVIGIYFALIGIVAWWYGRHQKDTEDYFLAGRNAGWVVIGTSIFTSNIGSEHIVGLAGQGAATGMAMAHWELHAWVLIMLAGLFVPFYYKSGVQTIPEFLEKRFSARSRLILSVVSLVAYVFTKVSVTVYAGAIVFQALLPDTFGTPENAFWFGAFATVIITGVYTVFGGMRAIMATSTPQAVIILFGSFVITYIGLAKLGGCGRVGLHVQGKFRPVCALAPAVRSWVSLVGSAHCLTHHRDLVLVHRSIHRATGTFGEGPCYSPAGRPLWRPAQGMAGAHLPYSRHDRAGRCTKKASSHYPQNSLMVSKSAAIDGDRVFPTLVTALLPPGIRGLIVACPAGSVNEFPGITV